MGKITVKHYLNKSTSKKASGEDASHQVYVQVTVKRQVNRKRSQIDELFCWEGPEYGLTKQEFEEALNNRQSMWGKALLFERNFIEDIITYLDPFNRENFTLANFFSVFHYASHTVFKLIEDAGKHYLELSMRDQWAKPYSIIDKRKPFIEIIEGLKILTINNENFNQSVLMNNDVYTVKLAIEHFHEYSETLPNDANHSDSLSNTAFYWFTKDMTKEYLNYLTQRGYIKSDDVNRLTEFFNMIQKTVFSKIESLSSKE